jgi:glycosyltransferase involved in cell wall biosynthesis
MTLGLVSEEPRFEGSVRVVTIAARNYLSSVLLLASSLRSVAPSWSFTAVLIDADDAELAEHAQRWPEIDFVGLSSLPLEEGTLARMALYYELTELATAIKPTVLKQLLEGDAVVMYVDPDIEVFDRLDRVALAATQHGIALTPHVTAPSPRDGRDTSEEAYLTTGQFNLGFIAVSAAARPFLDYWEARLERYALIDFARGYFTDQKWVDAVPTLFDHEIITDVGCNVAYWNLHQRSLTTTEEGVVLVNGTPLRFFHFSGHDADRPLTLSKYAPRTRVQVSKEPTLRRLLAERASRMRAQALASPPYRWGQLPSGVELTSELRRGYWWALDDALKDGGELPPAPGWQVSSEAFERWLVATTRSGLPRMALLFWRGSARAQALFVDPEKIDTAGFARWLASQDSFRTSAPPGVLEALRSLSGAARPEPVGVNVVGYLDGAFGMGQHGRSIASSIRAAGYPVAQVTLEAPGQATREPNSVIAHEPRFALNVVVVNADVLGDALVKTDLWSSLQPRPTVGVWAWELSEMPSSLSSASEALDELWCGSQFVADALESSGVSCPVFVHPWLVEPASPTHLTRADLGLDPDRFLFGFAFDVASVMARKNPRGLLEAYLDAFAESDGAGLVLKMLNAEGSAAAQALREAAAGRADVSVVDGAWSNAEMRALLQHIDCYVSLHRSEGTGLTMLEAMAAGTPVIATGYSGNLDFMDDSVGSLVPFELVAVGPDAEPYPRDALWADPDLGAASRSMKELAADPRAARALGAAARAKVAAEHGRDSVAPWFAARLDELRGAS